ncbi:MAG: hypothetical protein V4598_12000 [Bdellovibrionota bacterium]
MKLFLMSFFLMMAAHSQTIDQINHACGRDFKLWCKDQPIPSKKNQFKCFNMRYTELSWECQTYISKEMMGTTCGKEIVQLCHGADRNLARTSACLAKHPSKLGAECAAALNSSDETRSKVASACDEDFKVCGNKMSRTEGADCRIKLYKENKVSKACHDVMTPLLRKQKLLTQGR